MRRQARLDFVAENLRLKQNELADARVREVEKQRKKRKRKRRGRGSVRCRRGIGKVLREKTEMVGWMVRAEKM